MTSFLARLVVLVVSLPVALVTASAQRASALDLSGVTLYWATVDGLRRGEYGADSTRALLAVHPGYQLIQNNGGRLRALAYCFQKMRPRSPADSAATPPPNRASLYAAVCAHLRESDDARTELTTFARSLNDGIAAEWMRAANDSVSAYLPAQAMTAPPPIYVLVFENNAFGGSAIALDLLRLHRDDPRNVPRLLAHELHHSYVAKLPSDLRDTAAAGVRPARLRWLSRVQSEGIASLIDKGYIMRADSALPRTPLDSWTAFARTHADRLRAAPAVLVRLDSAWRAAPVSRESDAALDSLLDTSIDDGGHALGQFMATAIDRVLGRRELLAAVESRFAFVERYQRAAMMRPREYPPFSDATMRRFAALREGVER